MALAPNDVPITRDHVHMWLDEFTVLCRNPDYVATWQEFLTSKVKFMMVGDEMVNTAAMDDWDDETHIVDMILADMESYA